MNRLILIGNGFDLAHGMKTSYNDFILWYLKKCFTEADTNNTYEDDLIQITKRHNQWPAYLKNVSALVDHFYENKLEGIFKDEEIYIKKNSGSYVLVNLFKGKIKSSFLELLLSKCTNSNWVDIENEFYRELKDLLPVLGESSQRTPVKHKKLVELNKSLNLMIQELQKYLTTIKAQNLNQDYKRIFSSLIYKEDIVIKNDLEKDETPKGTLILNFNYTSTPEKYFDKNQLSFDIDYIHGKINDPNNKFIFGFGDELDSDYSKMELQKSNEFFEHIKSFWYFKTSNYHNLVRFIEADEFQVFILGHSCGLSDRTLLNMIFEHNNCKSIKIFYYGTKEKNNHTSLTYEISRHFKDKIVMRNKIAPSNKSEPMPQVE